MSELFLLFIGFKLWGILWRLIKLICLCAIVWLVWWAIMSRDVDLLSEVWTRLQEIMMSIPRRAIGLWQFVTDLVH